MRQHGQEEGKKGKGQVLLQWQLCKDEAEWQLSQQQTTADTVCLASQRSWRQWMRRWYVLVGVALFGIAGGLLWYQAQLGVAKIESELQSAIDAEAWLPIAQHTIDFNKDDEWQTQLEHESEQLHKLAEAGEVVTEMEVIELGQDSAVVRVMMQRADGAASYRQTRFYRRRDEGWLRTAPAVSLWGDQRRLETEYFIIEYQQRDAQAVSAIAAQVDALYTRVSTNFGVPLDSAEAKLRVEVNVMHPPGTLPPMVALDDPFILASPALYLAPDGISDDELLMQAFALHLIEYLSYQALWRYKILREWPPVLSSLRLWQLWELELPLSVWQDEVVEWDYKDMQITAYGEPGTPPEHYSELCATHALWMESPQRIRIPLECENTDGSELELMRWKPLGASLSLHSLGWSIPTSDTYITQMGEIYRKEHPGKAVALATLFEYVAVTYRREKLPALIAGFGRYEGWEALLPAVLGVSAADFETGWRSYLTQTYNVSLEQ